MGGTRCWVGTDAGVEGFDPDGAEPLLVAATPDTKLVAVGDALVVLRDGELELRDGLSGELRSKVSAPQARRVVTGGERIWLDEGRRALAVGIDGEARSVLELGDGFGVLAADDALVATMVSGAFDYGTVRVLAVDGATVLETPRLTNVDSVVFVGRAIVVASAEGIRRFPLDGGPDDARPGDGRSRVVAAPWGWLEIWDDRHDSSVGSRLARGDREGEGDVERSLPSAVLAAVAVGDETWAIISQGPVAPLSPAGPVTAVELDAGLATVRSIDLGEGAWRGGFAVCVAT